MRLYVAVVDDDDDNVDFTFSYSLTQENKIFIVMRFRQ